MSLYLKEIDVDDLSCKNPFVSASWASVKSSNGWASRAFLISIDDIKYEMLVLIRTIKFGHSLAYIPFAPSPIEWAVFDRAIFDRVIDNLPQISARLRNLLPKSTFAIRYDFPFNYEKLKYDCSIDEHFFAKKKQSVQPTSTSFIRLEYDLNDIRASYRKRARRYLRKNAKDVVVDEYNGDAQDLKIWYSIYRKTGIQDGFTTRSLLYIERIIAMDNSRLLLSRVDGKIVGGIIILCGTDIGVYLLGGSLKDCGYSVSYTLQDEAIRICKERGLKYYDLFGVGSDSSKHLSSLNLFKTSFGGEIIKRLSTFDYITSPVTYFFFKLAETLRYSFYRR